MTDETCWTLIRDAAAGRSKAREAFALRYETAVRSYLAARWRSNAWEVHLSDAVQEVFVETYKEGGVLQRVDQGHAGGFRAFLFGVVRRVAQRFEEGRGQGRERRLPTQFEEPLDPHLSQVFDRAYAQAMMRQAALRQAELARGDRDRERRCEILELRFREGLPIRAIAERWQMPAQRVHKSYAKAREEFREALLHVLREHQDGTDAELQGRLVELLDLLGEGD